MNELIGLIGLITAAIGIGAILLPDMMNAWTPHNPYRQVRSFSPWMRRVGLALVVIGLCAAAISVGRVTA